MGFGKNPHVAKAQAAELKAQEAKDVPSRERAWREAAHLWERALKLETDGKRRTQYEQNANQARAAAEEAAAAPPPDVDAVVVRLHALAKSRPEG